MIFEEKLKQVFLSGITQKELAERAGLSIFTINKIWLGKTKPNKKTRMAIEKAIAELEMEKRGETVTEQVYSKIYEEIKNSEEYKACFNCSFYLVCMDRPFQPYLLPCFEWDEDMLHEIVNKKNNEVKQ